MCDERVSDTLDVELMEIDLLLTPIVVFGLALMTKSGARSESLDFLAERSNEIFNFYLFFISEFSIEKIQDIEWNEEAFKNLVLPQDHKYSTISRSG